MAGRGRGGWGRGRGAAPPMGLTHADVQNLSREATAMYPPMMPPVLSEYTEDEQKIATYQIGFAERLRKSAYYIVEPTKSTDLPRYSDKYRPSVASHPTLKKKDLYAPYFPPEIFDGYFNPKKKRKAEDKPTTTTTKRLNIEDFADEDEDKETPSDGSDAGSQVPSDYDVDEEYDNDYAENYFDNGEGDDVDDPGGGGGGDEGGGGDYD